jgi:[acyl-carrier-protein] S-malonyltransferase
MKTAWVFPGQGSQATGMGADLAALPANQEKLEQAAQILGWSVLERCQSDIEELSRTVYTQPCLYTIECILVDLMRAKGLVPDFVAGHSLGEYVALYAAQVFDFATGLQLVKRRSELMEQVAGGMMAALIRFDRAQLDQVLAETPDVVLANDNSPEQVVISGSPEAVQAVMAAVKTKRSIPLKVSGAFHSPFMATAAAEYQKLLETVDFATPQYAVLSNVEPEPTTDASLLKQRLIYQMTGSVRWQETVLQLRTVGVEQVVEIGPGKVLTGLVKRTCEEMALSNISSVADLP